MLRFYGFYNLLYMCVFDHNVVDFLINNYKYTFSSQGISLTLDNKIQRFVIDVENPRLFPECSLYK